MKNANQIRQLITEIKQHGCCGYAVDRFNRILALLPCETCGGTGHIHWLYGDPEVQAILKADSPCPDCK